MLDTNLQFNCRCSLFPFLFLFLRWIRSLWFSSLELFGPPSWGQKLPILEKFQVPQGLSEINVFCLCIFPGSRKIFYLDNSFWPTHSFYLRNSFGLKISFFCDFISRNWWFFSPKIFSENVFYLKNSYENNFSRQNSVKTQNNTRHQTIIVVYLMQVR